MLIQCEKCQTRYNLDEAKIPGKGAKVTCPTCKNVFIVMKDSGVQPVAPAPKPAAPAPATPAPAAGQPKSLLDSFFDDGKTAVGGPRPSASVPVGSAPVRGIRSWKVKVASGLVYDFTDPSTLKTWIAERKVTTTDQISADGQTWTAIGAIPSLDAFFGTNPAVTNPALTMPPTQAPPTNPAMPAVPPAFGAPGVPPVTGFGPTPGNGPMAPAFAAPAAPAPTPDFFGGATNPQMPAAPAANPFGAPPPIDPFATSPTNPAMPAANPFGAAPAAPPVNPFGPAPTAPAANPFAAPPPATDPFAAANPFAAPGGFGGGVDPFAAAASAAAASGAPPSPAMSGNVPPPKAGDLFGGSGVSGQGRDPFAVPSAPAPAKGAAAPPPWSSSADEPSMPTKTPVTGGDLELDKGNGKGRTTRPIVTRPKTPLGAVDTGAAPIAKSSGGKRGTLRTIGMAVVAIAVVGTAVGIGLNFQRVKLALFPQSAVPTPKVATTPHVIPPLEGESRTAYLTGRRYMLVGQRESYDKAAASFRKALDKAPGNPRATAELLEALSLSKDANGSVDDVTLNKAAASAVAALRDDPKGLEINRALAEYYSATGHSAQAKTYLDAALAARPDDPEALLLRADLAKADPAKADAVKKDLESAAKEPRYSRAQLAWAAQLTGEEQAKAKTALESLSVENKKTLAALDAGSYEFSPEEAAVLMPSASAVAATPAPSASPAASAAASPAASAAASPAATVAATATPVAAASARPAASATPKATETKAVATASKTPKPRASPEATAAPLPSSTEVALATPSEVPTAAPKASDAVISTAGAEDHWVAGNALAQAGSWGDALAEYREAAKSAPKNAKYQLAVATALFQTGKLQDAAEILDSLIEADANNAAAHRILGLIYESTGQVNQACGEFSDFLRLTPRAREAADIQARVTRDNCGG